MLTGERGLCRPLSFLPAAAVISGSGVIRHPLPTSLEPATEPATVDQVGQQVAERARSQNGQERVLLNGTAERPAALAEVTACLGIAVQSFAHGARTPLIGVLGKIRGALRHVAHRLCGLPNHALCRTLALGGATTSLRIGA